MAKTDPDYLSGNTKNLPTLVAMDREIQKHAPDALKTLKDLNALDLVDVLGLTPYVRT